MAVSAAGAVAGAGAGAVSVSRYGAPTVDFQVSDWSDLDPHFTKICSDATLQSDRRGFFLDFAEDLTDSAGLAFIEEFGKLKDDRQRLTVCYSHPKVSGCIAMVIVSIRGKLRC